jgi:hypothetical protein
VIKRKIANQALHPTSKSNISSFKAKYTDESKREELFRKEIYTDKKLKIDEVKNKINSAISYSVKKVRPPKLIKKILVKLKYC